MRLQVRTKQIELVPTMCEGAEVKFIFRQPTQFDIVGMTQVDGVRGAIECMDNLLVEIKGEIVLVDEEGNEHKPKKFVDMFEFGGEELTSLCADVAKQFTDIITGVATVEKK